jgi:hypothetical protein
MARSLRRPGPLGRVICYHRAVRCSPLPVLVPLLAAAACSSRSEDAITPPRDPVAPAVDPPPRAAPEPAQPEPAQLAAPDGRAAPPRRGEHWYIERLSADGKRALQREISDHARPLRFRVTAIDTGAIEQELELPTLGALPRETLLDSGGVRKDVTLSLEAPAIVDELRAAAQLLGGFPLGASDRIAVAPDGKHVAFNAGDWIYTAVDGQVLRRVDARASYRPRFTPDGKALLYDGHVGPRGKYEVFATSSDGKAKPRRLAHPGDVRDGFALTDDAMRVVIGDVPKAAACVLEVALAPPHRVKRLGCLPGGERLMSCKLSPRGTWAACDTVKELDEDDPHSTITIGGKTQPSKKLAFRTRAMQVETGDVVIDRPGPGGALAISEGGLLVIGGREPRVVVPAHELQGEERPLPGTHRFVVQAMFRSLTELVVDHDGALAVIDLTRTP